MSTRSKWMCGIALLTIVAAGFYSDHLWLTTLDKLTNQLDSLKELINKP